MVYYALYVEAYENYDVAPCDYFQFDRNEFFEIINILNRLAFNPLSIRSITLVQYGYCTYKYGISRTNTVRLNSFKVTYPENNMANEPIFTLER